MPLRSLAGKTFRRGRGTAFPAPGCASTVAVMCLRAGDARDR
jgi:hypothetical protein